MTSPALTFVTTCKGRLHHLQLTLPLLVAQSDAVCVVVDYDCPDNAGNWVEANFPQVAVVRCANTPGFNPAHARNLGVAAAATDVICLIDADVMAAPEFSAALLAGFDHRHYYLPEPLEGDVSGTMVCARAAFAFADGYDEACTGWGGEDFDLYDRFELHGIARRPFAAGLLHALAHSDDERTTHHALDDKFLSNSINLIYSHIKLDLMRLSGARLPLDYRKSLHARVHDAGLASSAQSRAIRLEIPYADVAINFCEVQSGLFYMIDVRGSGTPAQTADPRPAGPRRAAVQAFGLSGQREPE